MVNDDYYMEEIHRQLMYYGEYKSSDQSDEMHSHKMVSICFHQYETNKYLKDFRVKYKLDRFILSDETSTVENILRWTYEVLLHNGLVCYTFSYENSMDIIEKAKKENITPNCYCHAYVLRDALNSIGIQARIIYCLPINCSYYGNHVVTEYYSEQFKKWILIDPTYCVCICGTENEKLNLVEFRNAIVKSENVTVICRNRFHQISKEEAYNGEITQEYLKMIIPLLVVIQYENGSSHSISEYRLIPANYLLPSSTMGEDGITYLYDVNALYESR